MKTNPNIHLASTDTCTRGGAYDKANIMLYDR